MSLVLVAQVLAAIGVIVLVLLQHGKGADMGAAFGSGSSGSLFGATGSANFLSRLTAGLAAVFFICTLFLAFISQRPSVSSGSVMDQPAQTGEAKAPAAKSDLPSAPASPASSADAAKSDAVKAEAAKTDPAKADASAAGAVAPKTDAGKAETAKPQTDATPAAKPASGSDIPK